MLACSKRWAAQDKKNATRDAHEDKKITERSLRAVIQAQEPDNVLVTFNECHLHWSCAALHAKPHATAKAPKSKGYMPSNKSTEMGWEVTAWFVVLGPRA